MRGFLLLSVCMLTSSLLGAADDAPLPAKPVKIDAEQAFVGERTFAVVNDGEPAGMIEVHSRFTEGGEYVIYDHSASQLLGVDEEIMMVLDGQTFAPQRVQVHGRMGQNYVDFNWKWTDWHVDGRAEIYNFDSGALTHHAIERAMPEGTLTRGTVLFLANAMPLELGERIELNWFNSQNGQIKPIVLTVVGSEQVTVPAGTFDTFKVTQEGGQPGNTLYITKDRPRRIVRFDVTGTAMQLLLQSL